jgi:hypothetical protein
MGHSSRASFRELAFRLLLVLGAILALMLYTEMLLGQTYIVHGRPRAAAGPFDPSDLSPEVWVQGDDIVLDTTIEKWNDLSGNGNDLTSTGPGTEPNLLSSYLNGHDCGDFVDNTDFSQSAGSLGLTQPFTFWMVLEADAASATANYINSGGAGPFAQLGIYNQGGSDKWYMRAGGSTFDTSPHYFVVLYNGASSYMRIDGSEVVSGSAGSNGFGIISIGQGSIDGNICEAGATDDALTGTELTNLESYLADRYGL